MTPEELAAIPDATLRDEWLRRGDFVVVAVLKMPPEGSEVQELIWAHKGFRYTLVGLLRHLETRIIAAQQADSL